jgi:hypothetical protein
MESRFPSISILKYNAIKELRNNDISYKVFKRNKFIRKIYNDLWYEDNKLSKKFAFLCVMFERVYQEIHHQIGKKLNKWD